MIWIKLCPWIRHVKRSHFSSSFFSIQVSIQSGLVVQSGYVNISWQGIFRSIWCHRKSCKIRTCQKKYVQVKKSHFPLTFIFTKSWIPKINILKFSNFFWQDTKNGAWWCKFGMVFSGNYRNQVKNHSKSLLKQNRICNRKVLIFFLYIMYRSQDIATYLNI